MEFVIRVSLFVISLLLSGILLAIPYAIFEERWSKSRLVGMYILALIIIFVSGRIIVPHLDVNSYLSLFLMFTWGFMLLESIGIIAYILLSPVFSRIKINWWKVLGAVIALILLVSIVIPLIPGVLFAFGIKTENWPIEALVVEPRYMAINTVTPSGLSGELWLFVQNSNPFPAQLSKIDIEVYSTDGQLIASGSIPYSQTIPPNKFKLVECHFTIPWSGGGRFILDKLIASLSGQKLPLEVKGYVYLDLKVITVPIPFSKVVYV